MLISNARRGRRRRGAAAVELALVMTTLVTLVLGAIDFGRFAYDLIAVTNAARVGASYGMMNNYSASTQSAWQSNIIAAATAELSGQDDYSSGNLNATPPTVAVVIDSNGLRRVRVTVNYRFQTLVNWPLIPHTTTIKRIAEMRLIR